MPQRPQQNFDAMRQDAIRRSKEMQRRAMPPPPPEHTPPPKPEPLPIPEQESPPASPSPKPSGVQELLHSLQLPDELSSLLSEWNGEKLALAGLLYLLYKEGADISLLLALAYILL